jgi:hypothetical protein
MELTIDTQALVLICIMQDQRYLEIARLLKRYRFQFGYGSRPWKLITWRSFKQAF